jgi:hypothetical protein
MYATVCYVLPVAPPISYNFFRRTERGEQSKEERSENEGTYKSKHMIIKRAEQSRSR